MAAFAGPAAAQAYDPYDPYGTYAIDPQYAQSYDPYYELHQIHYQLYLRSYGYYPYPYYTAAPRFVVVAPPLFGGPVAAQPLRAGPPAVRRR